MFNASKIIDIILGIAAMGRFDVTNNELRPSNRWLYPESPGFTKDFVESVYDKVVSRETFLSLIQLASTAWAKAEGTSG